MLASSSSQHLESDFAALGNPKIRFSQARTRSNCSPSITPGHF
jgi:hypothetical protein